MRRHQQLTAAEFAEQLDARITDLLEPTQAQVRDLLEYLDHLSRKHGVDYRQEYAVWLAGRRIEIRDAWDQEILNPEVGPDA